MLFLKTFKDAKFVVDGNAFQTLILECLFTQIVGRDCTTTANS